MIEINGARIVNAKTKRCQVFEKLKLLRKIRARSAKTPDSNSAINVTTQKITNAALSNKYVLLLGIILKRALSNCRSLFGERQR